MDSYTRIEPPMNAMGNTGAMPDAMLGHMLTPCSAVLSVCMYAGCMSRGQIPPTPGRRPGPAGGSHGR